MKSPLMTRVTSPTTQQHNNNNNNTARQQTTGLNATLTLRCTSTVSHGNVGCIVDTLYCQLRLNGGSEYVCGILMMMTNLDRSQHMLEISYVWILASKTTHEYPATHK